MYFLALSQAPPEFAMKMARQNPVTSAPASNPPSASTLMKPTTSGTTIASDAGQDHLPQRGLGRDLDAARRVGHHPGQTLAQSRDLAELTAHLLDHLLRGPPTASIVSAANRNGSPAPMNRPMNTSTLPTFEIEDRRRVGVGDRELEALEQREGGECRRADGEPLGDRGGGVAERVERVGDLSDRRVESGHLGDAAGVVGDRAVGVDRDDDAGRGEHADGGDGDAVHAAEVVALGSEGHLPAPVGDADTGEDEDHRRRPRSCRC